MGIRSSNALLLGTIGIAALAFGCGGGTASGTRGVAGATGGSTSAGSTSSGGTSAGGTSAGGTTSGGTGPQMGAPTSPMVYALVTADNGGATPVTESVAGAMIANGAALTVPTIYATNGKGDQNIASSGFAVSPDKKFVFVGHNTSNTVECLATKTDGSLVAAPGAPVAANQAANIAVHPTQPVVYVTDTTPMTPASVVDVFGFDKTTGQLAVETPLPVMDSVRGIAVDPAGRWLVTTHMFASTTGGGPGIAIYGLDATGAPHPTPVQSIVISSGRPASAAFDRTGTRLYVRNLDTGILAYSVSTTGQLTALNNGTPYAIGTYTADLVVSPIADYVYVLELFSGDVIHPFKIDAAGTLTPLTTFGLGTDDVQHFAIGRTGSTLFCTSRSQSHIRAFSIDASTGALTENAFSPYAVNNPPGLTGAIAVDD